jgi:hypothetical protein
VHLQLPLSVVVPPKKTWRELLLPIGHPFHFYFSTQHNKVSNIASYLLKILKMKYALLIAIILMCSFTTHHKAATYYLYEFKVKCITKCDALGSDQVYIKTISSTCVDKTSSTLSFNTGNIKTFTEIKVNNAAQATNWCMALGDKIKIYEKDLIDPDDLIKEITITDNLAGGQVKTFTGVNGTGKYEISFKVLKM